MKERERGTKRGREKGGERDRQTNKEIDRKEIALKEDIRYPIAKHYVNPGCLSIKS